MLRMGGGALFALALQLIAMFAGLGDDLPRRILFLSSYIILLGFVLMNLRHIGILIIGAGLLLNFVAIAANGGLMPITPETLARGDFPEDVQPGEWLSGSKDILLEREDVRLWALTDRFVFQELPGGTLAYSIGDVFIAAGFLVLLIELVAPVFRPGFPDRRDHNSLA